MTIPPQPPTAKPSAKAQRGTTKPISFNLSGARKHVIRIGAMLVRADHLARRPRGAIRGQPERGDDAFEVTTGSIHRKGEASRDPLLAN